MNERSAKLEEKGPDFPSMSNYDQKMQAARKNKFLKSPTLIAFGDQ